MIRQLQIGILLLMTVVMQPTIAFCQLQAGMVERPGGGASFSAEQYKIDRMSMQPKVNTNPAPGYKAPMEYEKPTSAKKEDGSIWIGGYCRFRKPGDAQSRYHPKLSEWNYCNDKYPKDTIQMRDNFTGSGTIPWAADTWGDKEKQKCTELLQRIPSYVNDGLPFKYFDSLQRLSAFSYTCQSGNCYTEGREYEFNRGFHYWVKRKEGSEKEYIKFSGQFAFSCGDDGVYFEINDKGQFKIDVIYDNWKTNHKVVETGRADSWHTGEWNEVLVRKDTWNTVSFFINGEHVYHYQIPDMPMTARFTGLRLEMPYEWEKKKLQYNVGEILVESYARW